MRAVRQLVAVTLPMFAISSCETRPASAAPPAARSSDWAAQVAAVDPAFAGRDTVLTWIDRSPLWTWRGDPQGREEAIATIFGELDGSAAARCRQHLTPALAGAGLEFLRTDAGQAMVEAEQYAMATHGWHHDDLPTRLADRLATPELVGPHALAEFREVQGIVAAGGSASPLQLALNMAAQIVSESESRAIAQFLATPTGAAWLEGRSAAWPESRRVGRRALVELADEGFVRYLLEDEMQDLILPRAEFDGAGPVSDPGRDRDRVGDTGR